MPEKLIKNTFSRARTPQSSEDEQGSGRKSPTGYGDDMEEEEDNQYGSQLNRKQRVEVSLEMPQLPVPYSDNNKVPFFFQPISLPYNQLTLLK